jgi:hypothetical protein
LKKQKIGSKLFLKMFFALVVVLIVLYAINIFLTNQIINPIKAAREKERPANLQLTTIAIDCENCYNITNLVSFIKRQNVKIIEEKNLPYTSTEAQKIISENNIKSLPALVISGQVFHQNLAPLWNSLGVQPKNNVVVINNIPPYYSLETQKIVGLVQVILLTDNSCAECYDVNVHMQILPRFGVYISNSLAYDIASTKGKELLQKYNITKVPTILLSPDAAVYDALNSIWNQVGTVEKDGWYVFRATEEMGNYRDLSRIS